MAIQWIDADYGRAFTVARMGKYEIRMTCLNRANEDGPMYLVSLFDHNGALDDRSWSFHVRNMDVAQEKAAELLTNFLKEQIARQKQLLDALRPDVPSSKIHCSACGKPCSNYTSVTAGNIDLALCPRCTEHLKAGLNGACTDKTHQRHEPIYVHVTNKGGDAPCEP